MKTKTILTIAFVVATLIGCASAQSLGLKDAYKDAFRVGAALNRAHIYGDDKRGVELVNAQFNSITPENVLKWESVHPKPGVYDFDPADHFVAFGEKNGMFIVGHTLVWHNQTPAWVFQDDKGKPLTRDALLQRMREHIQTVVGRYKGRINGWDVVNEALDEDGSLRQSPWMKIIGEDYIEKAFQFAHEADPKAELYYNDYSLENPAKLQGAVALIKRLQAKGVHVTGVGLQGHVDLDWPTAEQEDATISAFAKLGTKVHITEFDLDVLPKAFSGNTAEVTLTAENRPKLDPYKTALPPEVESKFTARVAELFRVYLKHRDVVERVTFWGVTDKDSWKNDWPVKGRTNYPLLFDRAGKPKAAHDAIMKFGQEKKSPQK